jgi:hypothetical protein
MKAHIQALALGAALSIAPRAAAQSTQCYVLDASFHVTRGDIVLITSDGGVIKDLMSSIGQQFTHSGMVLSATRVRHNSMDDSEIQQIATKGLRQLPDHLKATGPNSLRDGSPGVRTDLLSSHGFKASTSLVLTGPEAYRQERAAAAKAMERLDGYYRLYAYTDMSWPNPAKRADDTGNMCSGTVAWANIRAQNLVGTTRIHYSAEVRDPAAQVLFNSVRKRVLKAVPDFVKLVTRDKRTDEIAKRIANQLVNCMAFDDCGNTGERWRAGVGAGDSISPDDLIDLLHEIGLLSAWLGRENTFPYQWTVPVEVTSPMYCCRTQRTSFQCH